MKKLSRKTLKSTRLLMLAISNQKMKVNIFCITNHEIENMTNLLEEIETVKNDIIQQL